MLLTEEERDAKDGRKIVLAVNHAGINNYCGPIISVGVALDYNKIDPQIIEAVVTKGVFTKDMFNLLHKALKSFGTYSISAAKLNEIQSIEIATHMADYNALMGLIFDVFKVYNQDPDSVQVTIPIREVIKNSELSIYQNKKSKSPYLMRSDWTQFNNLIPNTTVSVCATESFSLLFAKAFANTLVETALAEATEKYKKYEFTQGSLSEKQKAFLTENGMTEYHRAFLPEMLEFAFSQRILI